MNLKDWFGRGRAPVPRVRAGRDVYAAGRDMIISPPAPPGSVTATLWAFQEVPPPGGWTVDGGVRYEGSESGGRLLISPRHPYLDMVSSGAELAPVDFQVSELLRDSGPARLDLRIVNNTAGTVTADRVRLEVSRAVPRVHAVPVIRTARAALSPWPGPDVYGPVEFEPWSAGHGPAGTLSFRLEAAGDPRVRTSRRTWAGYEHPGSGFFGDENESHPLLLALAELGARPVEDDELARESFQRYAGPLDGDSRRNPPRFHSRVWEEGLLPGGRAVMAGVVEYAEEGIDGTRRSYSHAFRAPLELAVSYPRPSPRGAFLPVSDEYAAPVLRAEDGKYAAEVPVAQSLAPGEADRVLIGLPVASASTYDFQVTLVTSAGKVDCGAVRLESLRSARV